MKSSKSETHVKFHKIPQIQFAAEKKLTSYAGLVLFQALAEWLGLKERLRRCFHHIHRGSIYGLPKIMWLLILHIMLGFRRLRGLDYYRDDPLVARVVGLRRLPDVATVSRALKSCDETCFENLRGLNRELVLGRLRSENLARLTVDFDGTVQSTRGHIEGTAVGFNKKKKGARSYYPLFATIAQLDQFYDLCHRPGNVHDSNGAAFFMPQVLWRLRRELPLTQLECRIDSAFYQERIFGVLQALEAEFTCTVPFERFPKLKTIVEGRRHWHALGKDLCYFESEWKPECWDRRYRLLFIRQRRPAPHKGPLQLDLFAPKEHLFEYKVIATNKTNSAKHVLLFHQGRGTQEKLFGEAKQHAALDTIVSRRKVSNQVFTLLGMIAHNLSRELQMVAHPAQRSTSTRRASLWRFDSLGTIRQRLLHKAGSLTRPQGALTLTLNANETIEKEIRHYLDELLKAA